MPSTINLNTFKKLWKRIFRMAKLPKFDRTVRNYLDLGYTEGEFGIEIEMEMDNFVITHPPSFSWKAEDDGSLRGISKEYVLREPVSLKEVPSVLLELSDTLKANNVSIKPTIRAGVHVHLNMQEETIRGVYRLLACYYPLETVLAHFCGAGRSGNLFCLRMKDAEYISTKLEESLVCGDLYLLRTNSLRYSALNLQSLFNYGSVEFRGLGTEASFDNILTWCKIIKALHEYSKKIKDAVDPIAYISGNGPKTWVESIFGTELASVLYYPGMEKDIIQDMRTCQPLLFQMKEAGI
jgi:hypothetical protein